MSIGFRFLLLSLCVAGFVWPIAMQAVGAIVLLSLIFGGPNHEP
jgi:hypothetical protein